MQQYQSGELVLLDTGDNDILVARVTSQTRQTELDVELLEWQKAGLMLPSIRLHKINTIEKRLVERRLGATATDWLQVRTVLQQLWSSL